MPRYLNLDKALLEGFDYPVCLVVEVTKQGVLLSKLRYLKGLGQIINQTIRCPSIEIYLHMGRYVDPFLEMSGARPIGIDWIFRFDLDKRLFRDTARALEKGSARVNTGNPMTVQFVEGIMAKMRKGRASFRKLSAVEKGMFLEPYCNLAFQRAGSGRRIVLQNVEVTDMEASIRVHGANFDDVYVSDPGPIMEADLLVITEIGSVQDILTGLGEFGFSHERIPSRKG